MVYLQCEPNTPIIGWPARKSTPPFEKCRQQTAGRRKSERNLADLCSSSSLTHEGTPSISGYVLITRYPMLHWLSRQCSQFVIPRRSYSLRGLYTSQPSRIEGADVCRKARQRSRAISCTTSCISSTNLQSSPWLGKSKVI